MGSTRLSTLQQPAYWNDMVYLCPIKRTLEASVESEHLCLASRHLSTVWSLRLPAYSPDVRLRFPRSDTLSLTGFGRYVPRQIADVHITADETLLTSRMAAETLFHVLEPQVLCGGGDNLCLFHIFQSTSRNFLRVSMAVLFSRLHSRLTPRIS